MFDYTLQALPGTNAASATIVRRKAITDHTAVEFVGTMFVTNPRLLTLLILLANRGFADASKEHDNPEVIPWAAIELAEMRLLLRNEHGAEMLNGNGGPPTQPQSRKARAAKRRRDAIKQLPGGYTTVGVMQLLLQPEFVEALAKQTGIISGALDTARVPVTGPNEPPGTGQDQTHDSVDLLFILALVRYLLARADDWGWSADQVSHLLEIVAAAKETGHAPAPQGSSVIEHIPFEQTHRELSPEEVAAERAAKPVTTSVRVIHDPARDGGEQ